uniref:Uncharacterized protein n=1 Tax=Anguilla anguilla TaxID=7936 RepID=A0A0E9RYP5_ANGAN
MRFNRFRLRFQSYTACVVEERPSSGRCIYYVNSSQFSAFHYFMNTVRILLKAQITAPLIAVLLLTINM